MKKGVWLAVGAYILWGLLPLYWKSLHTVPALEILAHRMSWSLVFVGLILLVRRDWSWLKTAGQSRVIGMYLLSAVLLGLNWFVYIWAVNADHIVETSLGYFINPLVNVLLGVLFLGERLRGGQIAALILAVAGVVYLTFVFGALPWIALVLAFSFGTYGLIRKIAALNSLHGLTLETVLLFIPAVSYLMWLEVVGRGSFEHVSTTTTLLLAGAGIATATPLLLFAAGARRITLTTLGFLQYIAPTLQLLIGVFIYHEPVPTQRWIGFCIIWAALGIYSLEGLYRAQRRIPVSA